MQGGVHVGLRLHQHPHQIRLARLGRHQKWRHTVGTARMHVRVCGDQSFDHRQVALVSGRVQCGRAWVGWQG